MFKLPSGFGSVGQRPPHAVINWDSPQARQLEAWVPATTDGYVRDLVKGVTLRPGAAGRLDMMPAHEAGGSAFRWDAVSDGVDVTAPTALRLAIPITLSAWVIPLGTIQANSGIFGVVNNNADLAPFSSYSIAVTADNFWRLTGNNGTTFYGRTIAIAPVTGQLTHICVSMGTGGTTAWVNGIQGYSGAAESNPAFAASALLYAGNFTGVTRNPNIAFIEGRIYSREFSKDQAYELYNPASRWDLYWRPSPTVYSFLPAASAPFSDWPSSMLAGAGQRVVVVPSGAGPGRG